MKKLMQRTKSILLVALMITMLIAIENQCLATEYTPTPKGYLGKQESTC